MDLKASSKIDSMVSRGPSLDVQLLCRIRGEYREMPGLRLSVEQATRLWSLNRDTCSMLLNTLLDAGYLSLDRSGRFMRAHGGY